MNRIFSIFLMVSIIGSGCNGGAGSSSGKDSAMGATLASSGTLTAEEARAIAKEAYIYAYPMADNYRIQFAYFVAKDNTEYKGPYNVIASTARVFTPDDKVVQTPNSDTPYSMLGLDLRAEPLVLTIPSMEKNRYFSVQLVDYYTHNFDYIGTRTTGNGGGNFLIAGPNWKGETPKGITKVIRSETEIVLAIYRTQLFNPADLDKVKKIQSGYKVQPLSAFLGQPAPAAAPDIAFIKPLTAAQQKTSLDIFNILNFQLQFCPTHPSETALRERFSRIGIVPGQPFDSTKFSPEILAALHQGIGDAWVDFAGFKAKMDKKEVTSGDVFGTREYLKNNYLYRMAAAILGIYGNSKDEAMYPIYTLDDAGTPLNGSNTYHMHFAAGQLPPVNAFWSLTMYEMPSSLLVANPIKRYLINSPMLPQLKKDADGGITLHIQNPSPGKGMESNWLPAPKGPFMVVLRLYWPKEEVLTGAWKQPPLKKVQ
jgi:hypothetical protein